MSGSRGRGYARRRLGRKSALRAGRGLPMNPSVHFMRSGRPCGQRDEALVVARLHAQQHRLACRPLLAASNASATSDGRSTGLPAASRMTSPACRPLSAAAPSGSTSVTTTPSCPRAVLRASGRAWRAPTPTRRCRRLAHSGARRLVGRHRAERHVDGLSARRCARSQSSAVFFGPSAAIRRARSCGSATASPLTAVMTSPLFTPGGGGGRILLRLGDQRARRVLDAEAVGEIRRHRLNLDAEPAARRPSRSP